MLKEINEAITSIFNLTTTAIKGAEDVTTNVTKMATDVTSAGADQTEMLKAQSDFDVEKKRLELKTLITTYRAEQEAKRLELESGVTTLPTGTDD